MYVTYLASTFRSVRFGLNEAHGKGMALQFNYFLDKGGLHRAAGRHLHDGSAACRAPCGTSRTSCSRSRRRGDYAAAKALLARFAVMPPPMQQALDNLKDIPVDIEPVFVTANEVQP